MLVLKENPDWHTAAQTLVSGCTSVKTQESRVQLLQNLCDKLGDNLYPAFLQILRDVSNHGTTEAKKLVADTLVHALVTGRLPAGRLSAWGSDTLKSNSAFGQARSLGPIEYICNWYAQPSGRNALSAQAFSNAARSLLALITVDEKARKLYCNKLLADINDPLCGSMSSKTRNALLQMTTTWQTSSNAGDVVNSYLSALQGNSLDRLADLSPHLLSR